jgi:hypothetical protein
MDDLLPGEDAPHGAFAYAYAEAQERQAEDEARAAAAALAAQEEDIALMGARIYDPLPYPEAAPTDIRMYAGTGIGALYGLNGMTTTTTFVDDEGESHDLPWSYDLEGWTLGKEPK